MRLGLTILLATVIALFGLVTMPAVAKDQNVVQRDKLLKKGIGNIDIIRYREGITDKLQYFTLYTEFVLITSLGMTLSKGDVYFDSDKMTLVDFAH